MKGIKMEPYQAKGYMFEGIVAQLLRNSGYIWDENIEESDQLQGRGSKHQIDAFGVAEYAHPFISKIRLLAECKYKTDSSVGVEVVRNMVGVIQDISQNYFSENFEIAEQILFRRYTDAGVVFTNKYFTKPAVSYGFAHNVFLVSYEGNPVMKNIVLAFENICRFVNFESIETKGNARSFIHGLLERQFNHRVLNLRGHHDLSADRSEITQSIIDFSTAVNSVSSVIAFINGSYPVHIFSESNTRIPQAFLESERVDNGILSVGYKYNWLEGEESVFFKFKISPTSDVFFFTLPAHIFSEDRLRNGDLIYEKERFLKNVVVPVVVDRKIVGQIILMFDEEFINFDWHHE